MLSSMLTTMVTLVIFELVGVLLVAQFIIEKYPHIVSDSLRQEAQQAASYFAASHLDRKALTKFLRNNEGDLQNAYIDQGPGVSVSIDIEAGFTVVIDTEGWVLATTSSDIVPAGVLIQSKVSAGVRAQVREALFGQIRAALLGQISSTYISSNGTHQVVVATAPIADANHRVVAVLLTSQAIPGLWKVLTAVVPLIWPSLLLVTTLAGVVGCVFGWLLSLWLARRFQKVSRAATRWSQGDFSSYIMDRSMDEIGQLAGHLNDMAQQLEKLVTERQRLTLLEERNRLARELHDSVKQQIFAIAMQVGSAQERLQHQDLEAAEKRLSDIDQLIYQVQQELGALIQHLRPALLAGKSLQEAIRELCQQWARERVEVLDLKMEGRVELPLAVEEALFRVVQEALTNVGRHSKARRVQVELVCKQEEVQCRVGDDGRGFDANTVWAQSIGVQSMQERMAAIGGRLRIISILGEGTQVEATVQLNKAGTPITSEEGK